MLEHIAELSKNRALLGIRRGIEKESLRVNPEGELAMTPHPSALGSALTHPNITTDFSEAQLEFITHTHSSVQACISQLDEIHRYTSSVLENEFLWPLSMPCMLGPEEKIPLAQYGTSNLARIKSIYRKGLANRYGRLMQTISGIHYNFSLPLEFFAKLAELKGDDLSTEFVNHCYMHLMRNFRRNSWLLILLFGASPAVCGTFVPSLNHNLDVLDEGSYYRPDATSLRMGPLGYQSEAQSNIYVSYNSLVQYLNSLRVALTEPFSEYQQIGIERDGQYEQLSEALLQIEAEYYGTIRPKCKTRSEERPWTALAERGIEWLEIRCLDIDPTEPCGVSANTLYFVDAFLLHSLLSPSPFDSEIENQIIHKNQLITVHDGGALPDLFNQEHDTRSSRNLAEYLLKDIRTIALLLDDVYETDNHIQAVKLQYAKLNGQLNRPATTILSSMRKLGRPFSQYGLYLARQNSAKFQSNPLSSERIASYDQLARESINNQTKLEQDENEGFSSYFERYMQLPSISS